MDALKIAAAGLLGLVGTISILGGIVQISSAKKVGIIIDTMTAK